MTGFPNARANLQEGRSRPGAARRIPSAPSPTRNTSFPSMPCSARAAPSQAAGKEGLTRDAAARGQARAEAGGSATRRPAIRRRKLQPLAPPPAVGGALARNGFPLRPVPWL